MVSCICCSGTEFTNYLPGLLSCKKCSHVFADMKLSDEELKALYSKGYFHGEEYLDYEAEKSALQYNFSKRINTLKKLHPNAKSLFELGCAFGYFLTEAASHYTVNGCDVSEYAVEQAKSNKNVSAFCGDLLKEDIPASNYDIACMWDTIEHLSEPQLYVEKLYDLLKSDGLIAISTGDIGSAMAKFRGAKWRLIHPPTHLHYFTKQSMTTMLQNIGFTDIQITYPPFWRMSQSITHHVGDRIPVKPVGKVVSQIGKILPNFAIPINTYDLMLVTARKRNFN